MLTRSFLLEGGRLRRLGSLSALCLTLPILAGCGGSSSPAVRSERVSGPGFSFRAPAGWKIGRSPGRVWAARGSELVQVASFPLARRYTSDLFTKVEVELGARMRQVASENGGTLSGPETVTAAGIRSHAYSVTAADRVDEYTFVLRGRREYQLLCRKTGSAGDGACATLLASFSPA
jgi:hypothetical protein